jgi:hypothetical protein
LLTKVPFKGFVWKAGLSGPRFLNCGLRRWLNYKRFKALTARNSIYDRYLKKKKKKKADGHDTF